MTDAEIRKSGRRALAVKYPMSKVSRAYEKGETQGLIKICVDAELKQILGAAILGVGGDGVVHVLLDTMYAKASNPHILLIETATRATIEVLFSSVSLCRRDPVAAIPRNLLRAAEPRRARWYSSRRS